MNSAIAAFLTSSSQPESVVGMLIQNNMLRVCASIKFQYVGGFLKVSRYVENVYLEQCQAMQVWVVAAVFCVLL